jgi:hypothetical protein
MRGYGDDQKPRASGVGKTRLIAFSIERFASRTLAVASPAYIGLAFASIRRRFQHAACKSASAKRGSRAISR